MASLIRYQPSRRGMADLLKSEKVDQMLEGRAQLVMAAAETGYRAAGHDDIALHTHVTQMGSDTPNRARVAVIAMDPKALRVEAKYRVLGGALDAGRFTSVKKTPTRARRSAARLSLARKQIRARSRRR